MASKPPIPELLASESFNITEGKNLPAITDPDNPTDVITVKTLHFKLGTGNTGDQSTIEVSTKEPQKLQLNTEFILDDGNKYYVQEINTTPVKFSSGSPLVTQKTSVRFPLPEAKLYTPEKIATFLIFKK